ncbi:putative protein OS=Stutzerimonas stutzeri OX=316 GN=N5C32_14890 PE=4 SV=1 [Stutzerimonas stutzeri]
MAYPEARSPVDAREPCAGRSTVGTDLAWRLTACIRRGGLPVSADGLWMAGRRRLLAREAQNGADGQARRRLVRSEIAGVIAIVALEASLLMQG